MTSREALPWSRTERTDMDQPDLFSQMPDNPMQYRRLPTPSVEDSPTSVARAIHEDDSGTGIRRRVKIANLLSEAGPLGLTWREVADKLGLHHGQASGALSQMHKIGAVFAVPSQARNGCQPYVLRCYRTQYAEKDRADTPATTKAGRRREALDHLAEVVGIWLAHPTENNLENVRDAHRQLDQ